jgi:hypothetical protein
VKKAAEEETAETAESARESIPQLLIFRRFL